MNGKKQLALEISLHPYLFDHRFEGRAVLPAVEAMQLLAVSTGSELPDVSLQFMRDGAFDKFLYLDDLADSTETTAINEIEDDPGGGVRAKLLTRNRLKSAGLTRLKQHVGLTFDRPAEPGRMPPFDQACELGGSVSQITSGQLYEELVPFGPSYQNIDGELHVSEEGAVAHLRCPPGSDSSSQVLGSPFALDAGFHAACVWGQRHAGIVAFPVAFGERVVFQPALPDRRYVSRAVPLKSEGDPPVLFFDLWIYSEEGEPCEAVRGLRMQDVSGGRWQPPQWVVKKRNQEK